VAFRILIGFLGIYMAAAHASSVEKTTAKTSYGAEIPVQISVPDQVSAGLPAVIVAPGQGYHMDLPILSELADRLSGAGVVVYRFNWNYYAKDPSNGRPSDELKNEIQDMRAVVALARADNRVKTARIAIGGKSLGSLVAYRVYQSDASLAALALLTPVISRAKDDEGKPLPSPISVADEDYPEFRKLARPVAMATSDQDPHCDLNVLADFLEGLNVPLKIVGGDHSWNVSADPKDPRNLENIRLGVNFVADWILQTLK
jgi:alpha/beta superfamily hydrolase